jgi:hypothetical protein
MGRWDEKLFLFTPEELNKIPDGTVVSCIDGRDYVKGTDILDDDIRFGYTAYGVKDPWNHELKNLFLTFKLLE